MKDLCVVFYEHSFCRAEVVEMTTYGMNKTSALIYLLDYGLTITEKLKKLYMLKKPHDSIMPFGIKCGLSVLNPEENELDNTLKYKLSREFEAISKITSQFNLYLSEPSTGKEDIYDVILFTEIETNPSTLYGAYLLHEVYGAFVRSKIIFDNMVCEEWSKKILKMVNECYSDCSIKMQIYISHIASPTEIYIGKKGAQSIIRNKIDKYMHSHRRCEATTEWSVGLDCFVRTQNWKTGCNLKQWYRGLIIQIHPNKTTFTVFLRDYGRKAEAGKTDLMPIPPYFAKPGNAVGKCRLNISNIWPESSTELLIKLVDEYKYFAISCVSKRKNCITAALWATNSMPNVNDIDLWDHLGLKVVSQSIRISMEPFIMKSQYHFKSHRFHCVGNEPPEYSDEYDMLKTICDEETDAFADSMPDVAIEKSEKYADVGILVHEWPSPFPIDRDTFCGFVTHVTETGTIYVQEESNQVAAYELSQSITQHLEETNHIELKCHIWEKGAACYAPFDADNYHRALIKKINREDGTCFVSQLII